MAGLNRRTLGLGIDVLKVVRMKNFISTHEKKLPRIFSEQEISWALQAKKSFVRFAFLFAAKEAVFKCLGLSPTSFFRWNEIEILPSKKSSQIKLKNSLKESFGKTTEAIRAVWRRERSHVVALAVREKKCAGF